MIWQFTVTGSKNDIYGLCDVMEEHADVVSVFENPENEFMWTLEGTVDHQPNETLLRALIDGYPHETPVTFHMAPVPDKDWLAENRRSFVPLDIAGFYIYGSHEDNPQWGDRIPLKIDASTAFGTGNHGTTHGCLAALQTLKAGGFQPRNPLDLGCGTGILALGIVKLFEVPTLATDMDPDATEKTLYNAQENDAAHLIHAETAEGLDSPVITQKAPFDLIVANILAGPLIDMASDLKQSLMKGGYLILSGILDYQGPAIKEAYVDPIVQLVEEKQLGDWMTFIFRKKTADEILKTRLSVSLHLEG